MTTTIKASSPVVRTIVNSVQRLYPLALADKAWDNTGLLLESPHRKDIDRPKKHVILLTIDLTRKVVDEAIALRSSMIITYHPIIFKPLKSLTFADTQQESLLRLAQEGISVYSPHTAVDAVPGGVNDWLADGISGGIGEEKRTTSVIQKVDWAPEGFEESGMGRIIVLKEPQLLYVLVGRVKDYLGLRNLMVCDASEGRRIQKIALCAGSGGALFKGLDVDLFFTGELPHHDALAAKERGISVITCFHTNTERGFLHSVMKPKLTEVLAEEWAKVTAAEAEGKEGFEIVVSKEDRDPYEII